MAKSIYENPIVMNMDKQVKKISEDLSITRVGSCNGKVYDVGLTIPIKGNKEIIEKLEEIGFYKEIKEKNMSGHYVYRMYYSIVYDKYAIYQTPFGLRAELYIDNMRDFKRHSIFGNPDFPMIVNSNGGHCPFIEEIDRKHGFLYFKEVPEDEEPLTREERYPKNSNKFFYGWIDPMGNTYTCGFEGHYTCAGAICRELGIDAYNAENELEKRGWLKVSRPAPYNPDNKNKRTIYTDSLRITKKQADTIYELRLHEDRYVRRLLKEFEF